MANSRDEQESEQEEDHKIGERLIMIVIKLGANEEAIAEGIRQAMGRYTAILSSDFNMRLNKDGVTPAEYVGHAYRTQGSAFKTFSTLHNEKNLIATYIGRAMLVLLEEEKRLVKDHLFFSPEEHRFYRKKNMESLKEHKITINVKKSKQSEMIDSQVKAHDEFLKRKHDVARLFDQVVELVAQNFVVNLDALRVSESKAKTHNIEQMAWKDLATIISASLESFDKKDIIIDPKEWPLLVQKLFATELQKHHIASNILIVGDSRYVSIQEPRHSSSMDDIFKTPEELRHHLYRRHIESPIIPSDKLNMKNKESNIQESEEVSDEKKTQSSPKNRR